MDAGAEATAAEAEEAAEAEVWYIFWFTFRVADSMMSLSSFM